jgi:hypothetical protein
MAVKVEPERTKKNTPLAIDLYCGRGGWTDGLLAAGFEVIGFDVMQFSEYAGQLVLQEVTTVCGAQIRVASLIVASPPCTEFSRFGKPCWFDVKSLPWPELSVSLVNAARRIAFEADVPLVLENVRDAQRFIGRAAAHVGSFYLWGDLPALLPFKLIKGCKHTHSQRGENHRCACGVPSVRAASKRAVIPFELAKYIGDCYMNVWLQQRENAA